MKGVNQSPLVRVLNSSGVFRRVQTSGAGFEVIETIPIMRRFLKSTIFLQQYASGMIPACLRERSGVAGFWKKMDLWIA
jgi:hypothetical protein